MSTEESPYVIGDRDYGTPTTYMVSWDGKRRPEMIEAHAIVFPGREIDPERDYPSSSAGSSRLQHIIFHMAKDGKWNLVLSARECDIVSIRPMFSESELVGRSTNG